MQRRLLVILSIAGVLIVGAITAFWLVNRSPKLQNTVLQIANINTATETNTNVNAAPTNTNTSVDTEAQAREFVARNFAESYGSGSSPDNFSNWEKAKPFATTSFSAFLDRTRTLQKDATTTGAYHAFLTSALVVTPTTATATTASLTVSVQRQETKENETTTYYQDLLLDLVKIGDDWKVNAASWKPL